MPNFLVPDTGCLLQTVDTFPKPAHEVLLASDFESLQLFHVDFFLQISCQECRHNVHLMNLQSMNCCDCEKNPDRCEFDDWCIGIEVIDSVDLTESSGH